LSDFLLFLFWLGAFIDLPLFTVQQAGHRLGIGEVIEMPEEGDGATAFFNGVVKPLVASDGDAVVTGHAVLRAGADEPLSLVPEECGQVYGSRPLLLFVCKMDIWHDAHLLRDDKINRRPPPAGKPAQ